VIRAPLASSPHKQSARDSRGRSAAGPFSGEPEEIAGDIRSFAAIGVQELIFDCRGQSITESIERLQWFATDVTPLVDG